VNLIGSIGGYSSRPLGRRFIEPTRSVVTTWKQH
jgi:hypothetical protein